MLAAGRAEFVWLVMLQLSSMLLTATGWISRNAKSLATDVMRRPHAP
jgi:hypothetical protein